MSALNRHGADLLEHLDETVEDLAGWESFGTSHVLDEEVARIRARAARAARAELRPRTGLVDVSPIDPPVA